MSLVPVLLFFTPSLAFRRAAKRALAREMSPDRAERIWETTKNLRADLRKTRPRHSPGVNLLLRYLEWDCALFSAAKQAGVPAGTAGRLVEEINWAVLGPVTSLSFSMSRLRGKRLRTRVKWVLDLMFGVIFTSPFERTTVPSTRDEAFNVTVCPLAQYFRDRGVPELTRYAACSLDYRMAAAWGVRLERTQTIAEGHSLCDFRFQIHRQSGSLSQPGSPAAADPDLAVPGSEGDCDVRHATVPGSNGDRGVGPGTVPGAIGEFEGRPGTVPDSNG